MSGVMEEAERFWELGVRPSKDSCLCADHFTDKYVKKYIRNNSQRGYCDYCNRDKKVISLEDFMIYIMEILTEHYTDAANFMSYDSGEGGYLGTILESDDLYEKLELDINDWELEQDILNSIENKAWASPNDYFHDSDADILSYGWNYFKFIVRYKARYLFYNNKNFKDDFYGFRAHSILKEVSKGVKKMNLQTILAPNTDLYRCRQHDSKTFIKYDSELAAPPQRLATYSNRMSPAGISMFYGSFDVETAIIEVIDFTDKKKKYITSASFRNKEPLNLIDFTKLPKMNLFNEKLKKNYFLITFLRDFIEDISTSIKHDGKEHIEYVPTQILTEFFRYIHPNHRNKIDGIIYPSSKNKKGKAVVLFMDHDETLSKLDFQKDSMKRSRVDTLNHKLFPKKIKI